MNEYEPMEEILDRLEDQYRFKPSTQILLTIIFVLIGYFALEFSPLPMSIETKVYVFVIYLALVFPVIIKVKNRYTYSIAMGLYGAASIIIIIWTYESVFVANQPVIGLYVAALEIIVVELLHHIGVEVVPRGKNGWAIGVTLTIIFFIAISTFLLYYGIQFLILVGVPLSLIFLYAILPERKI
ncbi:MAG: hypothetical protein ACP6IS_02480 [Candidatus Asgardarchaeia archaeon]